MVALAALCWREADPLAAMSLEAAPDFREDLELAVVVDLAILGPAASAVATQALDLEVAVLDRGLMTPASDSAIRAGLVEVVGISTASTAAEIAPLYLCCCLE